MATHAVSTEEVKTRRAYSPPGLHCSPVWGHSSPRGLGGGQAVLQDPPTPGPQGVLVSGPRALWTHQHFRCAVTTILAGERMRRTLLRWKKTSLQEASLQPVDYTAPLGTVSNISVSRGFPGGPMVRNLPSNGGDTVPSLVVGIKVPYARGGTAHAALKFTEPMSSRAWAPGGAPANQRQPGRHSKEPTHTKRPNATKFKNKATSPPLPSYSPC